MACILNIETSTEICSVAVSLDGKPVFEHFDGTGTSHAVVLGAFVEEALEYIRNSGLKADAVAVSCGPGSYTGLRIGVSMAKGLCFALNLPLIAIETTTIMAWLAVQKGIGKEGGLLCPMIDARRMEVYAALYDTALRKVRGTQADMVDDEIYAPYLATNRVFFFGNGSVKCRSLIKSGNAVFVDGIVPLASSMASLSEEAFEKRKFENTAYFEPFYLKEFIATQAKNKVLTQQQ